MSNIIADNRPVEMDRNTLVKLAAVNSQLYEQAFFPKTTRQAPASFHPALWGALEGNQRRLVNIMVMRDGAKTTKLRLFMSKRVAYGVSRTILYLGKSDSHATRSLDWLRNQVLTNTFWATTFGLEPGRVFNSENATIHNKILSTTSTIVALGINGSVRGINIDDYRPDLIVLDDAIDDDNASTPSGRMKTAERIHGAIKESLAPRSEAPMAKMVMLNTPIGAEDASVTALKDPEWYSLRFPCWTIETEDLPIEERMSSWEERYPTEEVRAAKRMSLQMGRAHIFSREKECKIVSPETAPLRKQWLQYYTATPARDEMTIVYSIDPVPKPTEAAVLKGLHRRDFEAHAVWGKWKADGKDRYYLLEYLLNKGHEPSWSVATFLHLALKWRPRTVTVDSVAYQTTLAWLLTQAMKEKGAYFVIEEKQDRRNKKSRILDTFQPLGPHESIYIRQEHSDFEDQWVNLETTPHDDLIDASAWAVESLHTMAINESLSAEYSVSYERIPDTAYGCP
jgi:hypothetical protein